MQSLLGIVVTVGAVIMTAACAGSMDSSAATGDPGPGPVPGSGGGGVCGAAHGGACASDAFCAFSDDACGAYAASGVCKPRPVDCSTGPQQVCGCDGQVYASACKAHEAGVDVGGTTCAAPPGTFACGSAFCLLHLQFCQLDPEPEPNRSVACEPLPGACRASSNCACLAAFVCGNCSDTPEGGAIVSCAGG